MDYFDELILDDVVPATEESITDDQFMQLMTEKLLESESVSVTKPTRAKVAKPPVVKVKVVRPADGNILHGHNLQRFMSEVPAVENNMFTAPVSTTNTIEGFISGVDFHEEQLIQVVEPCERVICYKCNYGEKWWPLYVPPVPPPKSTRGRKPVVKPKKPRKHQGNGKEFSSQITFVVRALESGHIYKIKLFRNGTFQLPGTKTELIGEVLECVSVVEQKINQFLAPLRPETPLLSQLTTIHVVMRNYKMAAKLPPRAVVNFAKMQKYLETVRGDKLGALRDVPVLTGCATPDEPVAAIPVTPHIIKVIYNPLKTKLAIIIATPNAYKPDKKMRVNVFLRGKINILGALDMGYTQMVCQWLCHIFENGGFIVIPPRPVGAYVEAPPPVVPTLSLEDALPSIMSLFEDAMLQVCIGGCGM